MRCWHKIFIFRFGNVFATTIEISRSRRKIERMSNIMVTRYGMVMQRRGYKVTNQREAVK